MAAALALHAIAVHSIGHAGLMIPESRNAIDRDAASLGHAVVFGKPTNLSGFSYRGHGQAALWWSQGCSIGCEFCLTDPKHPDNNGSIPTKPINGNPPHADKAGFRKSYCENPKTKAVLPKEYWTMNVHAADGAENDSYRYNPWRGTSSVCLCVSVCLCACVPVCLLCVSVCVYDCDVSTKQGGLYGCH